MIVAICAIVGVLLSAGGLTYSIIKQEEAEDKAETAAQKQKLWAQKQAEDGIRRAVAAGGTDYLFNIKLKERGESKKSGTTSVADNEPATNRAALSNVRKAFTFHGLRAQRTRGSPVTVS